VYKCERFFKANNVEDQEKVNLATIHMEGKALEWFQGYEISNTDLSWQKFTQDLILRFGPGVFDSPIGQLTKLRQVNDVKEYQEQFEALMARARGLTEEFFVECFISGLKDVVRSQVVMFQPNTLSQAIGLALLQEKTMEVQRGKVY
jgi:hypothetical protein